MENGGIIMKITKKQLVVGIVSIAIFVCSLALMLLDVFVPLNIWTHPVLTFLFALFVGFGVLTFVLAILNRLPWYFFLSAILLGLALLYVLLQYVKIWIALIIVIVFIAIVPIISFIVAGNKTEDIALNKSSEYKDYYQRKAEKEKAEIEKEKEELPEIKSFK